MIQIESHSRFGNLKIEFLENYRGLTRHFLPFYVKFYEKFKIIIKKKVFVNKFWKYLRKIAKILLVKDFKDKIKEIMIIKS